MNIHRLLAIAVIASSVALVGCGGGGGGGGGSSKSGSSTNSTSNLPTPDQGDQDDQIANTGEPSNPQLLLPVNDDDQLALVPTSNQPGQIAANPEPATAALAAVGLVFLATRRFGRREA